ncbi:MAG TPA: molybdopterin-guanine dinucleotide biosynthesis protein B [Chloroflexi bacterium]|jgi:molybdopterin-guanine dinucleotide biosynthesis protein MobB|nr:molybdopterin-guanine dinucleotide biosynthesis protein B [Chloroflexota bacterium]
MIPIIAVVGWHNVGKTTFIERLVQSLKQRGLRVATVKHSGGHFDMDREGTDTWRYAQAGSDVVMIAGRKRTAYLEHHEKELTLDDLLARLPTGIDLVVAEGFKREPIPKIEVLRHDIPGERIASPEHLVAIVSDDAAAVEQSGGAEAGWFAVDDIESVISHLVQRGLVPSGKTN